MYDWLDLETNYAWLYSTISQTIVRLVNLYINHQASKDWDKLTSEDKTKLQREKKTIFLMLFKGLIDFGMILYYIKPKYSCRASISYGFGVVSSLIDILLILKGGSL
mmetsp:Transcript_24164/g.27873  ORF Transcript_24164/g.27873 Transcript_24164/m.27873 type:complete len:107 (-) Transcript_24164:33-353(-)